MTVVKFQTCLFCFLVIFSICFIIFNFIFYCFYIWVGIVMYMNSFVCLKLTNYLRSTMTFQVSNSYYNNTYNFIFSEQEILRGSLQ